MYHFLDNSEKCTSSLELAAESSAECFLDILVSALSKSSPIAAKYYCNDSGTEFCHDFRSGTMSALSTGSHGEGELTFSPADSHAKTLVQLEQITASTEGIEALKEKAAAFGLRCAELLAKSNLALSLLKTPRHCGHADLALSCETLPRWGIMHDGECLEFANLARIISEKGFSSLLPTPTCHNAKEGAYPAEYTRNTPTLAAQIGGKVSPEWNEWRMGWPIGWADLKPLEMGRFQQWLRSHGKLYPESEMNKEITCRNCGGAGWDAELIYSCPDCKGVGVEIVEIENEEEGEE